jgi:hypothetical protein
MLSSFYFTNERKSVSRYLVLHQYDIFIAIDTFFDTYTPHIAIYTSPETHRTYTLLLDSSTRYVFNLEDR